MSQGMSLANASNQVFVISCDTRTGAYCVIRRVKAVPGVLSSAEEGASPVPPTSVLEVGGAGMRLAGVRVHMAIRKAEDPFDRLPRKEPRIGMIDMPPG